MFSPRLLSLLLLCALTTQLSAQATTIGQVAFFPFDNNLQDFLGNTNNGGRGNGEEFGCGVTGSALRLDGGNDVVAIPNGNSNNLNGEFDTEDFTLSLYFKPTGSNGNQYLVSKRDTNCNNNQYFQVRYAPNTRTVAVILRENNQTAEISHRITNATCWQHLTIVRDEFRVRLYLNGEEVGEVGTSSRVNVDNDGEFLIGSVTCRNGSDRTFEGLIDELRIYNRALRESEVRTLYTFPDQILNTGRRLFLGESLDIELNSNCGVDFLWSPTEGVDNPNAAEPTITPERAGEQTYAVTIRDDDTACEAVDSIRLQIIDPSTLDCGEVFLPKAFTPNGIGPVENETFGISNPFAIPELLSFEIYDRYGGRMFVSTDAFARWDGTFQGEPVNPGVMVWRVVFRCEGEELVESGSVTVLR